MTEESSFVVLNIFKVFLNTLFYPSHNIIPLSYSVHHIYMHMANQSNQVMTSFSGIQDSQKLLLAKGVDNNASAQITVNSGWFTRNHQGSQTRDQNQSQIENRVHIRYNHLHLSLKRNSQKAECQDVTCFLKILLQRQPGYVL